MEVFYELNKQTDLSLCLGFFDGVHQGHQVVIKNTVNYAKINGVKSALITFIEHPLCLLHGFDVHYISTLPQKLKLIEELGVDYVYILDFNRELAQKSAYGYLKDVLIENFQPKAITTGFNHYFGLNKQGNSEFLYNHQKEFGYKYFEIPPITYNNIVVSSSVIKNYLMNGDVYTANKLLDHKFSFKSVVQEGQKIGRTINFPTINLEYPLNMVKIPYGVYSVNVELKGQKYKAIANWGLKPTVNNTLNPTFEAHLLDFSQDVYGQPVSVEVNEFIRNEIKFLSVKELQKQIAKDILAIKEG
ncbi:bifunctional riboflavin kinase/FAD synthetase [bacterium]|nr:bifunctional riboflavin kinase/FAD synthetase [bacterium]